MALKFNWLREIWKVSNNNQCKCRELSCCDDNKHGLSTLQEGRMSVQGNLPLIYMIKPEILVGKWNGLCHSIWEASENMGCDFRWCHVSALSLFRWFGYTCTLWQSFFYHCLFLYNVQDFHPCGLCQIMVNTQDTLTIYFTNATLNFHTTSVLRIWRHQVTIFYHNNIEQFLIQWFRLIAMVNKSTHHENDMIALA